MGSIQMPITMYGFALPESCGHLLQELKLIWDEVGQDQLEREKVLLELEQECMDAYRRKVDSANMSRARLHQALGDSEVELTHLLLTLGERSFPGRPEKMAGTLKEQLDSITPALHEMQLRKEERISQFREVQVQIQRISAEIEGQSENDISSKNVSVNEADLPLKKLDEFHYELKRLLRDKSDRLQKVEVYTSAVQNLAATMGLDSSKIIKKVHPSLDTSIEQQPKNISDTILEKLNGTVESLQEEKQKRLDKLSRLQKSLSNLWNLMDSSAEERKQIANVIDFIPAKATDILSPGRLTLEIIHQVESEVQRLEHLKTSKMKELLLGKNIELEEICKKSHMGKQSQSEMVNILNLINSGEMDHADLLMSMDKQIRKAKEEASNRRDITEKVEKWMVTCKEERWLEDYNRDENRYSVRRGAHKNLKRAERARITVQRIPDLVDLMITKTKIWEEEREKIFFYDEVPLLAMLEEYNLSRKEQEEEKQRQREKKRLQGQMMAEQEKLLGSRPSTSSHHIPNRSLNGSFVSSPTSNRRVAVKHQLVGTNYNAVTQGNKKVQRPKLLGRSNLSVTSER